MNYNKDNESSSLKAPPNSCFVPTSVNSNRAQSSLSLNSPPSSPLIQPSTSNQSKLDQVVRNFINKFVQLILQNRITIDFSKITKTFNSEIEIQKLTSSRSNKWFNLETNDLELYRNQIAPWRQQSFFNDTDHNNFIPMHIDIILTVNIPKGKNLVLLDNKTSKQHVQTNETKSIKHVILLESWGLTLNQTTKNERIELPTSYKHSIIFFKGITTIAKVLPAYKIHRQLMTMGLNNCNSKHFRLGYRISTQPSKFETPIHDDTTKNELYKVSQQKLESIKTPIGNIEFSVKYRKNCQYYLVDHEKIFGNNPSNDYVLGNNLYSYSNIGVGAASSTGSVSTIESKSSALYKNIKNTEQPGVNIRPNSRSSSNRSKLFTDSPDSFKSFPIIGHHRNHSGRAPSITMVSPFKSPSLSSSPSNFNRIQSKISTSIDKRSGTLSNRMYSYTANSTLKLNSNNSKNQDLYKTKTTYRQDYFDNYKMGENSRPRTAITYHNISNFELNSVDKETTRLRNNMEEFLDALDNSKPNLRSTFRYDINTSVNDLEELLNERNSIFVQKTNKNDNESKDAQKKSERISKDSRTHEGNQLMYPSNSLPERGTNYAKYLKYNSLTGVDNQKSVAPR